MTNEDIIVLIQSWCQKVGNGSSTWRDARCTPWSGSPHSSSSATPCASTSTLKKLYCWGRRISPPNATAPTILIVKFPAMITHFMYWWVLYCFFTCGVSQQVLKSYFIIFSFFSSSIIKSHLRIVKMANIVNQRSATSRTTNQVPSVANCDPLVLPQVHLMASLWIHSIPSLWLQTAKLSPWTGSGSCVAPAGYLCSLRQSGHLLHHLEGVQANAI